MDVTSSPQRLKFLINSLKMNDSQFEKSVGASQSFISNIVNGKHKISMGLLKKISTKYPLINTHWLLTGEGSAFLEQDQMGKKMEMIMHELPKTVDLNFLNEQDLRKTLADNLNFITAACSLKKNQLFSYLMAKAPKQTITNYLKGSSGIPFSALIALEDLTGVPIKELLTRQITSKDLENIKI